MLGREVEQPFVESLHAITNDIIAEIDPKTLLLVNDRVPRLLSGITNLTNADRTLNNQQRTDIIVEQFGDPWMIHQVVAVSLAQHEQSPTWKRWREADKRYLLDYSLTAGILEHGRTVASGDAQKAYFGKINTFPAPTVAWERVTTLTKLQGRLRMTGNPTPASMRR